MKITNHTAYPTPAVVRLVRWTYAHMERDALKRGSGAARRLQVIVEKARRTHGRAYWSSVRLWVPAEGFPATYTHRGGYIGVTVNDWQEMIVFLTGHELNHHEVWASGRNALRHQAIENECDRTGRAVLELFRQRRAEVQALIETDTQEAARVAIQRSQRTAMAAGPVGKLAKAEADLKRWVRKAKLAATKMRDARRRVRYYTAQMAPAPATKAAVSGD